MRHEHHDVMTPTRAARLQQLIDTMPSFAVLPPERTKGRPPKLKPRRPRTIRLAQIKVAPRKPRTIVVARVHVKPRPPRTIRLPVIYARRRRGRPPGPPKPPRVPRVAERKHFVPEKPTEGFPLHAHASGSWRVKHAGRHFCFGSWRAPGAGAKFGPLAVVDPTGVMWRRAFEAFQSWRARPA